jgi:CubicO group peptidase (beta-lactamase class C family)
MTATVLTLATLPGLAQNITPERAGLSAERLERVDALIDRYMDRGLITGAVTLVARDGRIAHLDARGVKNLESREPMRTDTIFRIASMSKPVAGVAIMQLFENGELRLEDPVSKYLPSFAHQRVAIRAVPSVSGAPDGELETAPAERDITIFDLLTHTSGLMSGPMSNGPGQSYSAKRHELGLAWVDELGTVPLEFQPGERWAYSALAGFDVLSRIVEIVSGQDFNAYLQARIFAPLGMRETFFWPTGAQRERLVTAYAVTADGIAPNENPDSMSGSQYFSGAGGLMTTAGDYARFAMMLANRGRLDGARILGPRSVDFMASAHIPHTLPGRGAGEAFGLSVRVVDDPVARGTLVSEGTFGWSGAYGTHFFVAPQEKLVAIMMIQTPIREMRPEFENAVMQALVE